MLGASTPGESEAAGRRVWGLWVLCGLVTIGVAAPVGFLYAARRTGERSFYVAAALWGLVVAAGLILAIGTPDDSAPNLTGAVLLLAAWGGGFVHSLAVRPQYVELVTSGSDDPIAVAQGRLDQRVRAAELARDRPELARELGVGRPDVPGAEHMGVVDLNHASREAIAELPGVDEALAWRLVAAREAVKGFVSVEDAGVVLDLDPTTVDRLSRQAVFLPF